VRQDVDIEQQPVGGRVLQRQAAPALELTPEVLASPPDPPVGRIFSEADRLGDRGPVVLDQRAGSGEPHDQIQGLALGAAPGGESSPPAAFVIAGVAPCDARFVFSFVQ